MSLSLAAASPNLAAFTQQATAPVRLVEALRQTGALPKAAQGSVDYLGCLGALLERLSWQGDARQLCDALPADLSPASLFDLLNLMAALGYRTRERKLACKDIGEAMLPCLLRLSGQAPLVVLECSARGWLCYDAGTHERVLIEDGTQRGTALLFSRIEAAEDSAERYARSKTGHTYFRGIMARFTPLIGQAVACGFLLNLAGLATPLFVMLVYDRVIGARSYDTLPYLAIGVLLAILLEGVLRVIRLHALAWLGARVNAIVSVAIFERLLFLSPAYTERASVPAQLSRLRAFEMARDFFSGPIFLALLELPFVAVLLLAIWLIAGPLVGVALVIGLIYALLLLGLRRHLLFHIHRTARAQSERQQAAVEMFTRLDALKLSGVTGALLDRFAASSARAALAQFRSQLGAEAIEHLTQALAMVAGVATLGLGVEMIWAGELTIGALVAAMILTWRALSPLQAACAMLPRVEHIRSAIAQVNRLMTIAPEREPAREAQDFPPFRGRIAFSQVALRYSRLADPVFTGLSFVLEPGEMLAITGSNGAGKSSVLKLVAGLYLPQAGAIRIDDTDSRQFDPLLLRRNISYVPQIAHVPSGSLRQFLLMAAPLADEARLQTAIQLADLREEIDALPGGLDTIIGHMDYGLPAGLVAKLKLAQLYLNPQSIILCDELPGALTQGVCGEHFRQFLKSQKGQRSVLFVTQNRDLIALADKALMLRLDSPPRTGTPQEAINWLIAEDMA